MSDTLIDIREEDFEPNALRAHAEVCEVFAIAFQAELERIGVWEYDANATLRALIQDARRFAAVFRGLADRAERPA